MDRINFKNKLSLLLCLASLAPSMSFAADCTIPSASSYRVGVTHNGYLVKELDSQKGILEQGTCQRSDVSYIVHFSFDQATLNSEQKQHIQQLVKQLQLTQEPVQLEIVGYTDSRGSIAYNQRLGKARASAVRHYLEHLGVVGSRVMIHSEGELQPVASNTTSTGRALNRRAVITTK
ncbi:OmpA family protein [Celerinatantimonas yamalensis]|uniref:OmpA family protein n=1 Tax=Celerinatantimonas yamalensis TaxID=559956 RepID=A0ABW9G365_9GAMM